MALDFSGDNGIAALTIEFGQGSLPSTVEHAAQATCLAWARNRRIQDVIQGRSTNRLQEPSLPFTIQIGHHIVTGRIIISTRIMVPGPVQDRIFRTVHTTLLTLIRSPNKSATSVFLLSWSAENRRS